MSELSERVSLPDRGLHWIDRLSSVLAVVGGAMTVFLVVLTVIAVFFRYVLNNPIFGVDDLSQVALSVINGRVVVEDGVLLGADLLAMIARHNALSREIAARAAQ